MKKAGLLGLLALSFMFALPLAYAELFISSPSYLYNVGDKFAINTTVISGTNANDFLTMALVCATDTGDNSSEKEMEIFRVPLAVGAGEQKVIPVSGAFDNFLIGELRGVCSFRANFDGSTGRSSDFELSKSIDVVLNTEGFANPGESINVSGSAVKDNGKPSEGFVEVRVANSDANAAGRITNGRFAFSLPIPENARSGTYEVEARVYERDEYGKVTNEGSARSLVKIRQIVKKMNIAISSQSLVPGQELTYSIVLYDQAGDEAAGDVSLSIYDPSGKQVSENLVKAGGTNLWKTEPTFAPGNWQIGAKINSISGSNAIYLEELQNASFVIEGDNLVITNTGNVVYEKNVEITISDKKETKEVYLDVGESKVFYLSAPDGEYEIVASDGFRESQFSSFLTGNAIRVDDGGSRFWRKLYLPMWIMLIAIVGFLGVYHYSKVSNRNYFGRAPKEEKYFEPVSVTAAFPESKEKKSFATPKAARLENPKPAFALNVKDKQGEKKHCPVIALKVKNVADLQSAHGNAMQVIENVVMKAREAKAKVFSDSFFKTIIFSPDSSESVESTMTALKLAKDMEEQLNSHNAKFAQKIKFGIGVHEGEMVVGFKDGRFDYTPIGNTVPLAKKIAERADYEVGVSERVHRKLLGKVKSNKVDGENFWRIHRVIEREAHNEFIDKFVSRNKFKR